MATSTCPSMCQSLNRRDRAYNHKNSTSTEKRVHHHNVIPHIRPMQRSNDTRQRPKLRAKVQRPVNLISTDGTTSGDDGSETKNKQEEGMSCKFEQMFKPSTGSDLEADCEDNSYTDVDTVSLTGSSNKHENNAAALPQNTEDTVQLLHSKIIDLEKQLATVLQKNLKLTEENSKLREMVTTSK